jgi:4-aminobutyrate aminotransferase-like enzyme
MAVLNTNTRYLHPAILDFADELVKTLPEELCVVHMVNSGSEANELALRMAYTITGQRDMLALEVGYHGNTTGTVAVSSYKFDGKGGSGAPEYTHILPIPDAHRGRYRGDGTGEKYAGHTDELISKITATGRKPAGFIGESILSCGGQIVPPQGYFKEVYRKVREAGGICIADEVQTGCGRVGTNFWAFELHGVTPDIITIGKPIGNGHPLGVVVCTREVADAFANGMEYFNTFGGNPVSSVIGKEVLRIIKEEKLQQNALQTGEALLSELDKMKSEFSCIGDVRGKGLFLGVEFCTSDLVPLPQHAGYLVNRARDLGILMSTDGPKHNVVKIKPPMIFSEADAGELMERLNQILREDPMKLD